MHQQIHYGPPIEKQAMINDGNQKSRDADLGFERWRVQWAVMRDTRFMMLDAGLSGSTIMHL